MKWKPWLYCGLIVILVVFVFWIFWLRPCATRVIIVRHAEKADVPGDDDPLDADGEARAEDLVIVARDAGVSALYATQYLRTQQTVEDLAEAISVPVTVVDRVPDPEASAQDLAALILAEHRGQVVLVAGHSDTVPELVKALGAHAINPIDENEFDRLLIVDVPVWTGASRLVRASYGAASP